MNNNKSVLCARDVCRTFQNYHALKGIHLQLNRGEVLGLLGPNGAGKSTFLKLLAGILPATSGQISVMGFDPVLQGMQAKKHIGFLPEIPPLYQDLRVAEYLVTCAKLRGVAKSKVDEFVDLALERCDLQDVRQRLIKPLSKGYQQRIGIAQAIVHQPDVIILDEPTVGLDPIQMHGIRELISELSQSHGVILSTHILPEVQSICDRVQIINHGQCVFEAPLKNIDSLEQVFMNYIFRETHTIDPSEQSQ